MPALVKHLNDPDETVQYHVTLALGQLRWEPDMVVPALVGKLESKTMTPGNARTTMTVLGYYGTNATGAIPVIKNYLSSSDYFTRSQAQDTLDEIANAAANPAVK